ncbi:MAG: hypothetical protein DI598_12630 [Pseudopedobacter saltans]|uniref:Uncharacterized protein n=1 Tax=Pseudopedobacter saltans TaxID=151895 RepID=A0A2W5GJU6_9SPHI|nr:MAG: hypothetical protein DI598_12630 [Pseudopedobacter saltans]
MKTLSSEQIQQLFQFCEKHCVRYYDVQVELVDHLASAIETEMSNNPNITFEDCLQKEYKSFGATGFAKYLNQQGSSIEKKLYRLKMRKLISFLTIPKIILTISILIIVLYLSLSIQNFQTSITTLYAVAIFFRIFMMIKLYFGKKEIRKPLSILNINSATTSFSILIICNFFGQHLAFTYYFIPYKIFSAIITSYYIIETIALSLTWDQLKDFSKQAYPQAFQK